MESTEAQELLDAERLRVERLLAQLDHDSGDDRDAANAPGDMFDSAEPLTKESTDNSIEEELRERLAAIDRAERRLEDGSYGFSVRSGQKIPDDRLEIDPAAELTVEEAQRIN